ncbi:MAG: hypothetical protein KAS30_01180, partial [Candidatus Diapherotrites archaeon]|nr:hypothetical protein [Candidatus Diapherotrites archaeon]
IEGSSGNTLFIKNYGKTTIDGFAFYLDKEFYPYTSGPDQLTTNQVGTYGFNIAYGKHEVKLTTSSGLMVKGLETFGLQTAPTISNVSSSAGGNTATITWTTDTTADSTVNYGLTTGLGSTETSATQTTSHEITLTGLTPSTDYYFEVESTNVSGTTTDNDSGSYHQFTTTSDITDPVVSNVSVEFSYIGESDGKVGDISITWTTDENANSYVEADDKDGTRIGSDLSTYELTHNITPGVITIDYDSPYALRIRSQDASGNPTSGFNWTGTYNCPSSCGTGTCACTIA